MHLGGHLLLGGPEIPQPDLARLVQTAQALARVPHAVVHDEARAQGAHECVQIAPALVVPVGDPLAVEPQDVDLGVLGD